MRIITTKGKSVNVKDSVIQKYMKDFSLTKEDAIQMYLEDEGFEDNEEIDEIDAQAKKNKTTVRGESEKKDRKKLENTGEKKDKKPKPKKTPETKKRLFSVILTNLQEVFGENVKVVNENKLIYVEIDGDMFKIDIIKTSKLPSDW